MKYSIFLNEETYRKDAIEIMNLPEQEFQEWEESLGFKSMRSWIMEANDALGDVKSEGQRQNWKQKYGDIVKIEKNEVVPVLHNTYWQSFANRKGEFKIGKTLGKIYPEKTVLIQDGDRSKLSNAKNMNKTDLNKGIIVDLHNDAHTKTITARSGCIDIEATRENDDENRRVVYRFISEGVPLINGDVFTLVTVEAYADRKNWVGDWVDDNAELEWMDCSWQITDNNNNDHTITDQVRTSGSSSVHGIIFTVDCFDDTPSGSYVEPNFNYYKGRATSSEIEDGEYAVNCCGVPSGECPDADD